MLTGYISGLQRQYAKEFSLRISSPGKRVGKCLSEVRRKSHAPFLEGLGSATTPGYSTDLLKVFHCMNGGKLMNVRYSTTLKSERLTDAQCVNRLQTGITKAVIEMKTAARQGL